MRRLTVGQVVLAATLMVVGCSSPRAERAASVEVRVQDDTVPKTSVVLLVDVSQSFAPFSKPDQTGLESVAAALSHLVVDKWEKPVQLFVSLIGESSFNAVQPCGPPVAYRSVLVAPQGNHAQLGRRELTKPDVLQAWWRECVGNLTKAAERPQRFTDVSSALLLAEQTSAAIEGRRIVIVASDLVESLPPGAIPAKLSLSQQEVLLLYKFETADTPNPNRVIARIAEWEKRLTAGGAKAVKHMPLQTATAGTIIQILQ